MSALNFMTYNVRGLNTPTKRHKVLGELKGYKAGVVFLQETHLTHVSNIKLWSDTFPNWFYGDTITKRARGVAIGFAKGVNFKLEERLSDPKGRFIFLKGSLEGWECMLANIYAPNKDPCRFLNRTIEKLLDFKKGGLIMMGDLNLCLEPEVDSTSRALGKGNVKLRKLRQKLHSCQLVDTWRIMNPNKQDFTFYSSLHGT